KRCGADVSSILAISSNARRAPTTPPVRCREASRAAAARTTAAYAAVRRRPPIARASRVSSRVNPRSARIALDVCRLTVTTGRAALAERAQGEALAVPARIVVRPSPGIPRQRREIAVGPPARRPWRQGGQVHEGVQALCGGRVGAGVDPVALEGLGDDLEVGG